MTGGNVGIHYADGRVERFSFYESRIRNARECLLRSKAYSANGQRELAAWFLDRAGFERREARKIAMVAR